MLRIITHTKHTRKEQQSEMSFQNVNISQTSSGTHMSFIPGDQEKDKELHITPEEEEKRPITPEDQGKYGEVPVTPRDFVGLVCECHNLNWSDPLNNGGICDYTYTDGSLHCQLKPHPTLGHPCCDKLNLRQVGIKEYTQVCKYRYMDPSTCALPPDIREDLVTFFNRGGGGCEYDERLDAKSPNHYKKHFSSLIEMYDLDLEKSDREVEMCENMDFSLMEGEYFDAYGWRLFWQKQTNKLWDAETSLCCIGIMTEEEDGKMIPIIDEWAQKTRKRNPENNSRLGLPK